MVELWRKFKLHEKVSCSQIYSGSGESFCNNAPGQQVIVRRTSLSWSSAVTGYESVVSVSGSKIEKKGTTYRFWFHGQFHQTPTSPYPD